jgi:hypothetical protein
MDMARSLNGWLGASATAAGASSVKDIAKGIELKIQQLSSSLGKKNWKRKEKLNT